MVKHTILFSLLVTAFLIFYFIYKIGRRYKWLPFSLKELKKRTIVEGKTLHTWNYIPPLWQRVSGLSATLVLLGVTVFVLINKDINRLWCYISLMITVILFAGLQELHPRKYRLTDRGIWCSYGRLFSGHAKVKKKIEERLLFWQDVISFSITNNRIIFTTIYPMRSKKDTYFQSNDTQSKKLVKDAAEKNMKEPGIRESENQEEIYLPSTPESKVLPWNLEPLTGIKKILLYTACFSLFFLALFSVPASLSFLFVFFVGKNNIFLAVGLFFFTIALFAGKSFLYINRKLELPRNEKMTKEWGEKNSVFHLFNFRLRDFFEFSKINFRSEGMEVSGTLGPAMLPLLAFLSIVSLTIILSGFKNKTDILIYELAALPLIIVLYFLVGRRKHTLIVQPGNIGKLTLKGPVLTIKFNTPPIPGLKQIQFLVPPHFRVTFFTQFNRIFPGTLPPAYRIPGM